ncbi:MAG: single-stranded-DNA-specific exonuclease RecJ [Amphiplicatus sp.]
MGPTASGRRWALREADPRAALAIEQKTGVAPLVARALAARGVTGETARAYLNPSLRDSMPDPFVLRDMDRAAARLAEAVLSGETVGVFGDYDVDGTTAAAIFRRYFDAIGAPLSVYLPDRLLEGYGPSIEAFRDLARAGARLVVTVDCGASAHATIEQAAGEGLDVLVIDHHQMSGPPPTGAVAVVNPNRSDDVSGLVNLSAAGLAFMAVAALNRALREAGWFKARPEPNLLQLLDLAALGLVCDVMPITGLARVMVAQGLKVLGQGGNPGLKALAARAGVKGAPSTYHLGFLLGPRLNAAGRIGHARLALELLTGADPARLSALAERLHVMNAERQAIETAVLEAAIAQVEQTDAHEASVIVAAGEGWHPGVIGVVAGRLKEKYDRPAVVIGLEGEMGKGSGRSIAGVDLGAAVAAAKAEGLIAAGGGHAMAAGLTIARAAVAPFTAFLNERLGGDVALARADRRLDIDGVVAVGAVSGALAAMIERAGPFGPGNPEPLVALTNVRPVSARTVGAGHVSCLLANDSGETARAIAFRAGENGLAEMLGAGRRLHAAGRIRRDDWRGGERAQLHLVDAAFAE